MPRMIPPYISPDVRSNAEKKVYQFIKESNELEDFICLHSLGLSRHVRKRQGEIDFVLVGPGIILCLEVKGGRVLRKDGVWYFKDRFGQENKKVEGPFSQASTAMYSLKAALETKFGSSAGYLFGYGVVFTDFEFSIESPEWDKSIIYDSRDAAKPFAKYVMRLVSYWRSKNGPGRPVNLEQSKVVQFFRGDFELVLPLWGEIKEKEEQIKYFTDEQYQALDRMEGNERVIFAGPAGSGKTLLALEKARRSVFSGQKVLLLCFNRFLGAKLAQESKLIDPREGHLYANSVHRYFSSVIEKSGLKKELESKSVGKSPSEIFDQVMPSVFVEAFHKTGQTLFDQMVIDEGQDLLSENYLLALDAVLKGGLEKGCWTVFLDPGAQAKLFNKFSLDAYEYLKRIGTPEYKLDINCRNTNQIAAQAAVVSGFPSGRARVEGPKVEYNLYKNDSDQASKVVELVERLVREEGIPKGSITILSARTLGAMSLFTTGVRIPPYLVEINDDNACKNDQDKTLLASVQSFKGLENNVIIYMDVDSLNGNWVEAVNYVALTRAKEKLYVFMNRKLQEDYEHRLKQYTNTHDIHR